MIELINLKMMKQFLLNLLLLISLSIGAGTASAAVTPKFTLGPAQQQGDIDGPDGQTWFYTMDIENDSIAYSYYIELVPREYTIKIYDELLNEVGEIHDKVRYEDGETGSPYLDLLPTVTSHFFNDNDDYEFVVGMALNTDQYGVMHYRSQVYTLGSKKDTDGYDTPICSLPNMVSDVLRFTDKTGKEQIYFTMLDEEGLTADYDSIEGTAEYWDVLMSQKMVFTVWCKGEENAPKICLTKEIHHQCMPGDQQNTPLVLTKAEDGEGYIIFSEYEESLFKPYYSYDQDLVQRDSNTLKIEVYKASENPELFQTTRIPFVKDTGDGMLFTFMGIGSLRYGDDVCLKGYADDGKAYFIVNKSNMTTAKDDVTGHCYYVYSPDGTRLKTLAENVDTAVSLTDIPGQEPQQLFITAVGDGYKYNFVNLYSAELTGSMTHELKLDESDDPEVVSANIDRAPVGKSYEYFAEMRLPLDEDENSYMRIGRFDKDLNFIGFDEINMGKNVRYAQSYISGSCLHPDVFVANNNAREYMILIKRSHDDGSNSEELLVGRARDYFTAPQGEDYMLLTPGEHGTLSAIMCYAEIENPCLQVKYRNADGLIYSEYYSLPLLDKADDNAVEELPENVNGFTYSGNVIKAHGQINLYSMDGILLMSGNDSLDLTNLPGGIYIARTDNETIKIVR